MREHEKNKKQDQASRRNELLVLGERHFFRDEIYKFEATVQEQENEQGDNSDEIAMSPVLFRPDHEYCHGDADVQEEQEFHVG